MKVAVGIVYDRYSKQILITQRAAHLPNGGLWEFPGGKLENQETPEAALVREIKEEVNLEILSWELIQQITTPHSNPELSLFVFWVTEFRGEAIRLESQTALLWVSPQALKNFDFPDTNAEMLEWITQKIVELQTNLQAG